MRESEVLEVAVVLSALLVLLGVLGADAATIGAVVGLGGVVCWAPVVAGMLRGSA